MNTLKPFTPSAEPISLKGDLQIFSDKLKLNFSIEDLNSLIDFKSIAKKPTAQTNRTHELWKHTCFEAFWTLPSRESYWELNIAANGLWNIYYFDSYRSPSPPEECFNFELNQFHFSPTNITVILDCKIAITSLEASLAAIIKTNLNHTLYFATQHSGNKPDFHLRKSLQLKRNKSI